MLLRKIKAFLTKEKYYKTIKMRSAKECVEQLKKSQLQWLEAERKCNKIDKDYWQGRVETMKWVLKER